VTGDEERGGPPRALEGGQRRREVVVIAVVECDCDGQPTAFRTVPDELVHMRWSEAPAQHFQMLVEVLRANGEVPRVERGLGDTVVEQDDAAHADRAPMNLL
jgi:hypothetical protein